VRSFWGNLRWAAAFAAPWVARRLRRVTPGAGVEPKLRALSEVVQHEQTQNAPFQRENGAFCVCSPWN
jgi:hypothetical protein